MAAVDRIYGARHGVRGILNEDFVDLTRETSHNLELVAATPAQGYRRPTCCPKGQGPHAGGPWKRLVPVKGVEPSTFALRMRCSTN